jgi:uncharacterized protein YciI
LEAALKFIVLFEDNTAAASFDVRRRHMPEHLAFLQRKGSKIQAAGPLTAPDGQGAGGLWLVTANGPSEIDSLIKKDPFWSTGLRDRYVS